MRAFPVAKPVWLSYLLLFFFINLQPLKKGSTTNYAQFALDREPGSLTDILRPRAALAL